MLEKGEPILCAPDVIKGLGQLVGIPTANGIAVPPEILRLHIGDDLLLPFQNPVGVVDDRFVQASDMLGHLEMARLVRLHPGANGEGVEDGQHHAKHNDAQGDRGVARPPGAQDRAQIVIQAMPLALRRPDLDPKRQR